MGMSLYPKGMMGVSYVESLDYNWSSWDLLVRICVLDGMDVSEFKWVNDGDLIGPETCKKVADALEKIKLPKLEWMKETAKWWRDLAKAGGAEQW